MRFFGWKVTVYVNSREDDWSQYTKFLTFAYNTSVHSTTAFEPFYLMFSRKPTLVVDTLWPPVARSMEKSLEANLSELRMKWQHAIKFAEILTDMVHQKNAEY